MKKMRIDNKVEYQNLYPYRKQAKRESLSKDGQQINKKSFVSSNLVNFDINCYPFMNEKARPENIYRTALNLKISNDQLRKLMKLNHPNMINIQKITRGHNKEVTRGQQSDVYFSFYFEEVPFSLKYLALYQDRASNILKKLTQANFIKILSNLSEYLGKIGVFYLYNLGDIGITRQGEIKVYVSPVLFCDDRELRGQKSMIFVSIDKIVAWWQTTIASNTILNPKSSNIVLPQAINLEDESSLDQFIKANQSSFIDKEASQLIGEQTQQNKEYRYYNSKQSMLKNFPLKNSNNSIQSELSKISSYQINKIKKIDQEIKYIKERLKNKKRINKQSQQSLSQIKDKYKNIFESDRFQKKDLSTDKINTGQPNVIEKIQQNINCINIYTHPKQNTSKNSPQVKVKKMTSQPIYSYKISPDNFKTKNNKLKPQVIVHHPSFAPQDFPNSESGSSVNTYDMDLQAEIQPAKAVQKNTIFSEERQISEKNYRPSYDSKNMIQKKNQNQVAKKHVTQSAGPLQFKNFINKHIKPQFLAKKSNIYQDPMQYQSQTSKSISKKKKIISDLYQNGKSANSHTQKSSSLNQKAQQGCYKKKDNAHVMENSQQYKAKMMMKQAYSRTNSQIKLMPVRQSSADNNNMQNLRKSKNNDSKIGQRVKLVLQKTKNAIALLNRVKNSRSPPPKFP